MGKSASNGQGRARCSISWQSVLHMLGGALPMRHAICSHVVVCRCRCDAIAVKACSVVAIAKIMTGAAKHSWSNTQQLHSPCTLRDLRLVLPLAMGTWRSCRCGHLLLSRARCQLRRQYVINVLLLIVGWRVLLEEDAGHRHRSAKSSPVSLPSCMEALASGTAFSTKRLFLVASWQLHCWQHMQVFMSLSGHLGNNSVLQHRSQVRRLKSMQSCV